MSGETHSLTPWGGGGVPARYLETGPGGRPEELGPRAVAGFLLRRKWTILGTLAAVIALAAVVTLLWPATYRSSTTVLVQRQRGPANEAPALAALERLGQSSVLETETELIRSRRVMEPVVDSLDLHVLARVGGREARPGEILPAFDAGSDARPGTYLVERRGDRLVAVDEKSEAVIASAPAGGPIAFAGVRLTPPADLGEGALELVVSSLQGKAGGLIAGALDVSPVNREGDILRIRCAAGKPEDAQRLCSAVVAEYVELRTELQRSEAANTAAFLREQVGRLQDSLSISENRLKEFKKRAQVVAIESQASEEIHQYAQLKAQRDVVEAERAALSSILARTEGEPGGARRYRELASFPAFLGNQTMGYLMQELAQLETQRADLARRRTEENPELVALDQRIDQIDRQVGGIAREYARSLGAQVGSLDRALGGSAGRLSSYPERQVEAERYEREVASLTSIYNMLEGRLREAEVAEAVNQPPVRLLDAASLPLKPSSPKPFLNLLLAIVLGLGLGLAAAIVKEGSDTRIHDRRALTRRVRLPVLAMLPYVRDSRPILPVTLAVEGGEATHAETLPVLARQARPPARAGTANGRGLDVETALEVFRSLGVDLQFVARRLPQGDLRSLAITSAGRGEGKTYTACNLAIARASFGVHTLLIDADMRGGGVSRFFDFDTPSPGLSDLLSGRATARDARRTLRVNGGDVLSVMPSGEPRPDAAELLETAYFEAMLSGAQAVYDLVIIDTPPLNVLTDASAVVASADAVLVVVREGVTEGDALELTLERLERAGGNVVGLVFNDVHLPRQFAYGRYTYGH